MSTVAATLSASILSDDSIEDHPINQKSLYVQVHPDAVGFCIGKHRSNLRRIGNKIREDSGFSVFIKFKREGQYAQHFEITSEDRLSREQAKSALLHSERYFHKKIAPKRSDT